MAKKATKKKTVKKAAKKSTKKKVAKKTPQKRARAAPTKRYRETQESAQTMATLCHLSALIGFIITGVFSIIFPLIIWLIKKDDHPFIDEQGKEAVNFHLSLLIYWLVLILVAIISIPLILLVVGVFSLILAVVLAVALFIFEIIAIIVAAIKANKGVHFRYPLTIRFIK